jgi:hypothetical protein
MRTRPPPATNGTQPLVPAWLSLSDAANDDAGEECGVRRAVERVPLLTLCAALLRPDRARVCPASVPAPVEPLAGEVMPTPNSGGLALALLPEPLDPEVSCLAAGMGI